MARPDKLKLWLVSAARKDAVYEVLKYDPDTGMAELKGKYATISQQIDPAYLKNAGYELTQENPNAVKS